MTDELPPPRERTLCPLCGSSYTNRMTRCTINRAVGLGGKGWCTTGGSWTTYNGSFTVDDETTFIDVDQRTIDKGKELLSTDTSTWTERDWALRDALAALERIRGALTDTVLDAWAEVPEPGEEARYRGPELHNAMGASAAAAFAGMPPWVWASPNREPLVQLRKLARAEAWVTEPLDGKGDHGGA